MISKILDRYLVWVKVAGLAALFAAGLGVGCSVQKSRDAAQLRARDARISQQRVALLNAAHALHASSAALREVNAEAARRIEQGRRESEGFGEAGKVAAAARDAAQKRADDLAAELEAAKRRRPACAELARTVVDMEAACGITVL